MLSQLPSENLALIRVIVELLRQVSKITCSVCVRVCVCVCACVYMCVYIQEAVCTYVFVCMNTYVCVYVYVYVDVQVYICVSVYAYSGPSKLNTINSLVQTNKANNVSKLVCVRNSKQTLLKYESYSLTHCLITTFH